MILQAAKIFLIHIQNIDDDIQSTKSPRAFLLERGHLLLHTSAQTLMSAMQAFLCPTVGRGSLNRDLGESLTDAKQPLLLRGLVDTSDGFLSVPSCSAKLVEISNHGLVLVCSTVGFILILLDCLHCFRTALLLFFK